MKIADLTLYGSNAPLSTASPLPTAVEHASIAGYEYTAPQQVNTFTSGYENILDMGSCTGYDDAEAIIKIVKDSNKDITVRTAYGRNYAGNWAGAPDPTTLNYYWQTLTEPMGLVVYEQNSNRGFDRTIIEHPAAEYQDLASPIGRLSQASQNYRDFINSANSLMNNPNPNYIDELNYHFNRSDNQ